MMPYSIEVRVDVGIKGADYLPHTFITINDSNGNEESWGFALVDR